MKTKKLVFCLVVTLCLGAAWANGQTTIYVSRDGLCSGHSPCYSTIQAGIDALTLSSTIRITQETYSEDVVLDVNQLMALEGGWDTGFTSCSSHTVIRGSLTLVDGTTIIGGTGRIVVSPPPPTIISFTANPAAVITGQNSSLDWSIASAISASIDQGVGSVNPVAGLVNVSPAATTVYTLTATNAAGSVTAQATVTVIIPPTINVFSADPATINLGESSTLSWTITNATSASIDHGIGSVNPASGSVDVSPTTTTTYTLTAANPAGSVTAQITVTVTVTPPPDPATVAPPIDPTVATTVNAATSFLYTGPNPIQTGVSVGTIDVKRTAVLRGRVMTRDGQFLPGVIITILSHPEYGLTVSRLDGMFDMAVNGGGLLTVNYEKSGFLPAQRQVNVPWQDFVWLPEVVMIPVDPQVTTVNLLAPENFQVARGSVVTDSSGSRQATLLFTQGTQAELVMPVGSTQPIMTLTVRATEYTVGPNGPNAMPAELPPTSVYTYCVEFSADEAIAAGATGIQFSQPVATYVENFLNFPVGIGVPVGYYDRSKGAWVPSPDGRVVKIISISAGLAELDTDGDGAVDNGVSLGITNAERQQLAGLYVPGQTLWRVSVSHFTPYDLNYGVVQPLLAAAAAVPGAVPADANHQKDPCTNPNYGCIEFQNQILGEAVNVTGTSYGLHYTSNRVPGFIANSLKIPLSKNTIPPPLKRIQLEVLVAGRKFVQSFPAAINQEYTFLWDGLDAYGRPVQGQQPVTIRIGYVYDGYYALPPGMGASFGSPSGVRIPGDIPAREEVILWQEEQRMFSLWDARGIGLGGWSLSPHHAYDPQGKVLYYGTGRRRGVDNMNDIFETYAGGGTVLGDGGPATQAKLKNQGSIKVGPDGSLYIADGGNRRVRKVAPDGTITTVAGNGTDCFPIAACGDGGPAVQASVVPSDIALGPDGSLYIADTSARRIRKVGKDGIITRVAGAMTFSQTYNGDDIPALDAVILPRDLEVAPDRTIYFRDDIRNADNSYRVTVRRIGPDGIIHRYAGSGGDWNCNPGDTCGDGGPAVDALLAPTHIALGPEGSLYIYGDNTFTVRRVRTDGIIETIAGKYDDQPGMADGVPATQTHFFGWGVALDRNGLLHIGERGWWDPGGSLPSYRVRRVGNDQIITTVAGGTNVDSYSPADEKGPAVGAHFNPFRIALGPDGSLFISDLFQGRVFRVHTVFKGFDLGNILIASEDGSLLYQFNANGRHLSTINTLTGATLYQFGYDAQNRLISIADGDGNVTTVERDAGGNPTAIVGPFGQRTTLTLNAGGYLASVANPAGETTQLGYGNGGLLTSVTGPKGAGFTYSMTYDGMGRLTLAQDPADGSSTLTRTELASGHQVGITTAMGRTSSYLTETLPTGAKHNRNTFQDGTVAESNTGTDGIATTTLPDGTVTAGTSGPDPRFGMQAPIGKGLTTTTGGLTSNTTSSRSVTLGNPIDPLSLQILTDTATINGRTSTSIYDSASKTFTAVTPLGRQSTATINNLGRIVSSQIAGLYATNAAYDGHGRVSNLTTGTGPEQRTTILGYDINGYLETVTDSLGRVSRFSYDPVGRMTQQTLPDGRLILYNYDSHNNLTSVTPPGRPAHTFNYTTVEMVSEYIPPDVGAGTSHTLYSDNTDHQLTQVTRPDGGTVNFSYNPAGKPSSLSFPGGSIGYAYDPANGKLTSMSTSDGGTLSFAYSGSLFNTETWAGTVAGNVSWTYDNNFRVTSTSINGGNTIAFQYDNDSLLTGAGDLTLIRNAQNGLLAGTTLGSVTDSWSYNGFGEPLTYAAAYGAGNIYSAQYAYDNLGRITQKTETIGGATDTYDYSYDLTGRLSEVEKNGSTISTYTYDSNGNRLSVDYSGSIKTYTYDAQDRLLTQFSALGTQAYSYTPNGELQSKTTGGQTTTYQYDALGNLLGVTLPDATQIQYVVDGRNRRIGKKVNGTLVKGFLYGDQLSPVVELDGSNNPVSVFVYGSRSNVPDYMVKGGITYRIISDHLGSPRLVVNSSTGTIAQRMDYDEFGRLLNDTNPGFQPFGFVGGLYDPDTGLIRFGARDYDPEIGRWAAKDPVGIASGDTNFYAYVMNNPINMADLSGLGPGTGPGKGPGAGPALIITGGGLSRIKPAPSGIIGPEEFARLIHPWQGAVPIRGWFEGKNSMRLSSYILYKLGLADIIVCRMPMSFNAWDEYSSMYGDDAARAYWMKYGVTGFHFVPKPAIQWLKVGLNAGGRFLNYAGWAMALRDLNRAAHRSLVSAGYSEEEATIEMMNINYGD